MSVKQWGPPGQWEANYAEIAYSDDNGNTWFRSGTQRPGNSNFIQVAVAEQSGYLLFWGIPAGRFGGVKIARVLPSDVLDKTAYQYYTGTGWSTNEEDGVLIVEPVVGELSVLWNPYLQRWIMMYLNESTACIEVRGADQPHGPWGGPIKVACANDYPALYGAFMHDKYIENDGETVYFLMSQFGPYNVFLMEVVFRRNVTEVIEEPRQDVPQSYALHQIYPNPFNPVSTLRFDLPQGSEVSLIIYDILGREATRLVHSFLEPGSHQVQWEGGKFPSGIYIARMVTPKFTKTIKMVLLK